LITENIVLTSLGILKPKPGFRINLDSVFLRPPFLLKKMVPCFWKPLSFFGEGMEKRRGKQNEK
jgi:hypothetical protein